MSESWYLRVSLKRAADYFCESRVSNPLVMEMMTLRHCALKRLKSGMRPVPLMVSLFIHGATGTPQDWQYIVQHIDRTRFQPWFFYYPTGLRIESMAYLLLWKLSNLQAKFQFERIYFTAHSMGGLVARSFIVNFGPNFPYVDLFISLATPWGGDPMAELGVKQSPVVIPSWIDMQPEGDFVKSLYRKKFPDSVGFYLFYGFRGNRNPFRSNNDGTITLSSLLDARPQAEADKSYAFDEDHASILTSEKVVSQYNAVLKVFDEKDGTALKQPGGYIKVNFSCAYEAEGPKPRKILVLQRKGNNEEEFVTYLDDADNGKIVGPFQCGEYAAGLAMMAAKTEKEFAAVSIEPNKIKELNFVFQPEGVIHGYLTTALNPDDKFTGRPDHRYRTSDTNINIQSIVLQGNGVHRRLEPIKGPEIERLAPVLFGRLDYCYNNHFCFYGLPAGEYTVSINADGYQPIENRYAVMPGKPEYYRATELTPE